MKKIGLIGWPIAHSLSPNIHNAGFKAEGLSYEYDLVPIEPTNFGETIGNVLNEYEGLNVTTPYKESVLPYLDVISENAKKIQAVNTIYRLSDGRLAGDSTDGEGFWQSSNIEIGATVVLIGAGGAARSIMAALPKGIELVVLNRHGEHFIAHQQMVQQLTGLVLQDLASFHDWHKVDVVVDATTVGMTDLKAILSEEQLKLLKRNAVVIDLKYKSKPTPLMNMAASLGIKTFDGKGMLLEQAILAHKKWIKSEPNKQAMFTAIEKAGI